MSKKSMKRETPSGYNRCWLTDKSQIFTAENAEDAEVFSGTASALSAFSAVK